MLSITVHGPATATVAAGGQRILLGTEDAPGGDPALIVLNRTSATDAARLGRILREHNNADGKPTIVTGDAKALHDIMRTDEVCQAYVRSEPMSLSLDTYAQVVEAPPLDDAKATLGVYRAPGFAIFVDRCSWMRSGDALRTWLYNWDAEGPHNDLILRGLFDSDQEALKEVNRLEEAVTDQLNALSERIGAGEDIPRDEVPVPVLKRFAWAPYCREAGKGFAHLTFTLRRTPHDVGGTQRRATIPRCRYTEDLINKEFHL